MSGSTLRTHENSPIDLGKIQVFFSNDHESAQWPERIMFWEKWRKYGLVQTTCSMYDYYAEKLSMHEKRKIKSISCFQ